MPYTPKTYTSQVTAEDLSRAETGIQTAQAGVDLAAPQSALDVVESRAALLDYGVLRPGWVPASWRQGLPGFTGTSGTANTNSNSRILHLVNSEQHELRLVYWNPMANDITVRAGVELLSAIIVPVYFNGVRDVTIPAGHLTVVVSDPIPVHVLAGSYVYTRTKVSVTAGGGWKSLYQAFQSGEAVENEVGSTDKTLSGTITGAAGFGYGPAMVLGLAAKRRPFVAVIGDSITALLPPAANGFTDNWHRLALGSISYVALGQGGNAVTNFNANGAWPTASSIQGYPLGRSLPNGASHVLLAFATNDVFNLALPLATLQANFLAAWNSLAAQGKKVFAVTCVPRTTSTDSWATVANQTVLAQESVRVAFNAWIRTVPAPLTGYFDWADAVESARDSGKWKAAHTTDGIHPNGASGAGHTALAAAINPAVFVL